MVIYMKTLHYLSIRELRGNKILYQKLLRSPVRPSVCLSVCKLFIFSSWEPLDHFNHTWHKTSLGKGDLCLFKWSGTPFSKGNNLYIYEITKIHQRNLKTFFFRTIGLISNKLGTKHSLVKWVQIESNEGSRAHPRWGDYEKAKIHWRNFKIFFSRSTLLISTKLGTTHPWVKGIQSLTNKNHSVIRMEMIFFPLQLTNSAFWYNDSFAVLIDLNWSLRWAMWPMGLLFFVYRLFNQLPPPFFVFFVLTLFSWKKNEIKYSPVKKQDLWAPYNACCENACFKLY